MGKDISQSVRAHELEPVSLSALIHQHVRAAIETAVHEELRAALGTSPYERNEVRRGYRNGIRERTLTGPTGPVVLALPRATLFRGASAKEWTSTIVPRYQRRIPEVNEAVVATYLAGGNTRRIRGALQPLLKAAPLSKSAVSRVVATLKGGLEAWRTRSLADLDVIYVYSMALLCADAAPERSSACRCWASSASCRRAQASARPRTVRERVVLGMERLPRRSRRTRVASAAVGDHRR
jgi:transposase-like protein